MSSSRYLESIPYTGWDVASDVEWHDLEKSFQRRARHRMKMPDKLLVARNDSGQIIRSAMQYIESEFHERWGIQNHPPSEIRESWSMILWWLWPLIGDRDAVEVYPRDSRIINTAPIRWFWVLSDDLPPKFDLSRT